MERTRFPFFRLDIVQKLPDRGLTVREILFWLLGLSCLLPWITAPLALLMGLVFANVIGHPYAESGHKATDYLLQMAVVGLGFGIRADEAFAAGRNSFGLTVMTIAATLILGIGLGKLVKVEQKTAFLVAVGTAICGGSAIAAVSPAIKARRHQISMALGAVFVLNSLALFVFPRIGHLAGLNAEQFGTWCAIAIHDTSSVVGAASQYGERALKIATTVKLARALWIIPVVFFSSIVFGRGHGQIKTPYFIGFFVLAVLGNSYVPDSKLIASYISQFAHSALTLSIFLIGCGLSRKVLFAGGLKTLGQAGLLWFAVAGVTLWVVMKWF